MPEDREGPSQLPQTCGLPPPWPLPLDLGQPCLLAPVTGLFLPSSFQEKNHGPSRRSPGTPRPPGSSRGGQAAPQQGGRAGMGRASRSWEDSPGEQPRGGAGGRGRRGRGRGSPHLSGAGDASTADRRSKVGAGKGPEALAGALRCHSSLLLSDGPFVHLSTSLFLFLFQPLHLALSLFLTNAVYTLSFCLPFFCSRLVCACPPTFPCLSLSSPSGTVCLSVSGEICPVCVRVRVRGLSLPLSLPPWICL